MKEENKEELPDLDSITVQDVIDQVNKESSNPDSITCPDCKGGLNAQGIRLDCRTCDQTGKVTKD